MNQKVIIIGSGFGALGAAARLAARGYDVEVFEKRDKPGGRAYVYEQDGFKFDGGPTVVTAPFMFDDIFAAAGRRREEYVEFTPLDPFYRIFDHTGQAFDYNDDAEFIAEIQRRYGGIPAAVVQEADLMALLLPGLCADIEALETHLPAARPPLTCPIAVFGGDRDGVTPLAHLEAWRGETTGPVRVRVFSGGHFYLDPCRAEVIADVAASLSSLSTRQS